MNNLHDHVIELIHRTLCGDVSLDEASHFLSSLSKDTNSLVVYAAHAIVHFVTDQDLRNTDHRYDILLRDELNNFIKELEGHRGQF